MNTPKYTMTNTSITVVINGETHSIKKGDPDFDNVREAVFAEDWDVIPALCSKGHKVAGWLSNLGEGYEFKENLIWFKGERIPHKINQRMLKMAQNGESPQSLANFWRRLQKNPSHRSVTQLYDFLSHHNIPIDEDGYILAYKSVRRDYKDYHSGRFDNSPGTVNEMPRNRISDDPRASCAEGFHVGAMDYVRGFFGGERIVICKVDPADVVSVPYDSISMKMRVCKYEVIGLYGADLPDTTYNEEWEDEEIEDEEEYSFDDEGHFDDDDDSEEAIHHEGEEDEAVHWLNFGDLTLDQLRDQTLSDLRKYARHELNIIGASKIRGGKPVLLDHIRDARG